jgi:hypothetical protein
MVMHRQALAHEQATIERFRKDPELARAYLEAVMANGSPEEKTRALRRIALAFNPEEKPCQAMPSGSDIKWPGFNYFTNSQAYDGTSAYLYHSPSRTLRFQRNTYRAQQ